MHNYNKTFNNNAYIDIVSEDPEDRWSRKSVRRVSLKPKDGMFDFDEAARCVLWAVGPERLTALLKKIDTSLKATDKDSLTSKTWSTSLTSERATWANGRVKTAVRVVDGFHCRRGRATFNFGGREVDIIGNEEIETLYFYLLSAPDLADIDYTEMAARCEAVFIEYKINNLLERAASTIISKKGKIAEHEAKAAALQGTIEAIEVDKALVSTGAVLDILNAELHKVVEERDGELWWIDHEDKKIEAATEHLVARIDRAVEVDRDATRHFLALRDLAHLMPGEETSDDLDEDTEEVVEVSGIAFFVDSDSLLRGVATMPTDIRKAVEFFFSFEEFDEVSILKEDGCDYYLVRGWYGAGNVRKSDPMKASHPAIQKLMKVLERNVRETWERDGNCEAHHFPTGKAEWEAALDLLEGAPVAA